MLLAVEEQDSICWHIMLTHTKLHNVDIVICQCVQEVCPALVISYVSTAINDGIHPKKVSQSVQKHCREKEKLENKIIFFFKGFCVTHKLSNQKVILELFTVLPILLQNEKLTF